MTLLSLTVMLDLPLQAKGREPTGPVRRQSLDQRRQRAFLMLIRAFLFFTGSDDCRGVIESAQRSLEHIEIVGLQDTPDSDMAASFPPQGRIVVVLSGQYGLTGHGGVAYPVTRQNDLVNTG